MEITPLSLIVPDFYTGPNLQAAVNQAAQGPKAAVWIPANYAGTDTYTNPSNVPVYDMRGPGSTSFSSVTAIVASNPATCTVGQQFFNTTTGQLLTCTATNTLSNGGSSSFPVTTAVTVGTGGSITATGTGSLTATNFNGSGPNPYVDIRAFGAVALNTATTPYLPGITATCTAGNTVVPVSSSVFINGEGVAVWNCGATNSFSTPNPPAVTCVLAAGPTGTGLTVPCAVGGTETVCYELVLRTKGQGLTAHSIETCVTGQTRGSQSVSIVNCIRSANTLVTCITGAHTLAVGAWVKISGTTNDSEYAGYHVVTTVPDNTHFTYQWGRDSRAGASTIAVTGGIVHYMQGNHIVIENQAPPTNAWQYGIYRGASSSETFSDVSIVVTPGINQDPSYMTWDDWGATYTTVPTGLPSIWPNTPPTLATNDTLVTTVCSGGGTTSLTLCNAPVNSSGGTTTIVADNTPAYLAAFTFAQTNRGMVYTPAAASGFFATNTILDISSFAGTGWSLAGNPYFGDTLVTNGNVIRGDLTPAFLTGGQFSLQNLTTITFNAKPGMYTKGGVYRGLAFNPNGTNTNAVFVGPGPIPTGLFEDDAFLGASVGNDFASIPLYIFAQGLAGSAAAGITFTNIFTKGTAQGTTPLIISKNYGELNFEGVMMAGRGAAFLNCPTCTGIGVVFTQKYENQGSAMPLFVTAGPVGMALNGIVDDTSSQPIVSHLGNGPLTLYTFGVGAPSSGIPQYTGTNIQIITGTSVADSRQGINTNYTGVLSGLIFDGVYQSTQAIQRQNTHFSLGPNYSLFTDPGTPAAPTCVVITAGPPFAGAGTYTFSYIPSYANGGQGVSSPVSNSCVADGVTQQVTVSLPSLIPGVSSYTWQFQGNNFPDINGVHCSHTTTPPTLTWTYEGGSCGFASQPAFSGGGPAGIQNGLLWGNTLNLGTTLFANLPNAPNFTVIGCSDCTIANPCAGSGTGAFAKRLNGAWVCN